VGRHEDPRKEIRRRPKSKNRERGKVVTDNAVDIGWRLDRLNISRFHWRVLQMVMLAAMGIET
jgi:hypothetical protein